MKKKKTTVGKWWWIFVLVGLLAVFAMIIFIVNNKGFEDRGLPIINIELNGVSLEEINGGDKDIKYSKNRLRIINNKNVLDYDNVEIKGRGNSTWLQEKKPYSLKFEERVDFLGMGRAKKWYLLANHLDTTALRNETAFYLAYMLGMEYRFEGEFVELYIDGDYRGLYYLTHAVEIDKNVVDLKNQLGILVELDNVHNDREKCYKTGDGDTLTIKDVVDESKREEAMNALLRSYNELEIKIREGDFEGIEEVADIDSLAQYYLLSEFTVNPDAYVTSFYLYKDGEEDKLHFGPGWDFDLALGNRSWGNWLGERFYSPNETMVRKLEFSSEVRMEMNNNGDIEFEEGNVLSKLMFNLMELSEFQEKVKDFFRERMSGREKELIANMSAIVNRIKVAVGHNNQRWGIENYDDETKRLMEWVERRYEYFEQEYGQEDDSSVVFL